MPITPHPEDAKHTVSVNPDDVKQTWASSLIWQVRMAEADRAQWEENLTRRVNKRMGIRPSTESFPWPGANNVHIH